MIPQLMNYYNYNKNHDYSSLYLFFFSVFFTNTTTTHHNKSKRKLPELSVSLCLHSLTPSQNFVQKFAQEEEGITLHFVPVQVFSYSFAQGVGDLKRYSIHYDRSGRSKGTAEVVFVHQSDVVAAMKKYNNVQLDGKPMQIELVGVKIVAPVPVPPMQKGILGGNPTHASESMQGRMVGRGQERAGSGNPGSRRDRGQTRGRPQKVSVEDLDADLEMYVWKH